jgi:hypothetical protein
VPETVADGLVQVLPADAAHEPLALGDEHAALAVALAESHGVADARVGGDRACRPGHDVAGAALLARRLGEEREHALARLVEGCTRDRGGRVRVPAPAERGGDLRGVDRARAAPDDREHALVHLHEQHERPRVGEVDDLVREVRDSLDVVEPVHGRDQHFLAGRVDRLDRVQ